MADPRPKHSTAVSLTKPRGPAQVSSIAMTETGRPARGAYLELFYAALASGAPAPSMARR